MALKPLTLIRQFIQMESASGLILLVMAILALIISNSPWQPFYEKILHFPLGFSYGNYLHAKPVEFWINDGLMALFFLLVGLEIKREFLVGELNTRAKRLLPGFAALGGMAIPACIYAAINWENPMALRGWAIPTATDIAFTLGFLSLLGSRVPLGLKVFLTALAILDDLGAIIIIAIFYTQNLSEVFLTLSLVIFGILAYLNYSNVTRLAPYLILGFVLWWCILQSGIHSTIAGVLVALTIPLHYQDPKKSKPTSPLRRLERGLHPWIAFGILPLFAFANAGLAFSGNVLQGNHTIPLGIIAGLVLGKPIGVMGACWLAVQCKLAKLPDNANWSVLLGIACMCGIGFTMSLFVGSLAFGGSGVEIMNKVRMGVLAGSAISTALGFMLLFLFCRKTH